MSPESPHRWALARFAARRAGLLDDEEERRIADHLASCAACREAWNADAEPAGDRETRNAGSPLAHIPAGVLASWPRANANLRGLERAMIREHLEGCESCRQELEMLGYAPVLEVVPALEWSGAVVAETEKRSAEEPAPEHVIRVFKLAPRRRDWTRWAFGGWAALASAAALVLVLNPGLVGRGPEEGPIVAPATGPPETARGVLALTTTPLDLRSDVRGGTSQVPERTLSTETRYIPLSLEPLDLPDSSAVVVEIQREGDAAVIRTTITNGELDSGRLLLSAGEGHLAPGAYVVRLRGGPAPDAVLREPAVAEYHFVLKAAAAIAHP